MISASTFFVLLVAPLGFDFEGPDPNRPIGIRGEYRGNITDDDFVKIG
jgi:hypothetical protein